MSSLRVESTGSILALRLFVAGVMIVLAPGLLRAQTLTESVGMSLRVLAPIGPSAAPGMSMHVTREGIATITPRPSAVRTMSATVTTLTATDDRGQLAARFAVPTPPRRGQQSEIVVNAPTLVAFGLLSTDSASSTGPARAYLVRLRETGTPVADTGVVRIRLRQVIVVAGT